MLKVLLAASLLLPLALFGYAASLSHRNGYKISDERIDRSLEILHRSEERRVGKECRL